MVQRQVVGMEAQAIGGGERLGRAVERVAEDGVAERRQVHPELVLASGRGAQLYEGRGCFSGDHGPTGVGLAAGGGNALKRRAREVGLDAQINLARVGLQVSRHPCHVDLLDGASLELRAQRGF